MLRCTSCCWCLGLQAEVVAGVLGSKRGPNAKMYDLLPVSWARSGVRMLRCTICCRCLGLEAGPNAKMHKLLPVSWAWRGQNAKMYDLLPVSWARSGVRVLRCTICCRCLGLEAGSECFGVGFLGDVLGSKRGPSAKMYDLLPVSWARSGVRMQRCTFCCNVLGSKRGPNAKINKLLPVSWARSRVRMLRCMICGSVLGSNEARSLRMLKCTNCCWYLGLEVGSEC